MSQTRKSATSAYCAARDPKKGAIFLHGLHQVAVKSTNTVPFLIRACQSAIDVTRGTSTAAQQTSSCFGTSKPSNRRRAVPNRSHSHLTKNTTSGQIAVYGTHTGPRQHTAIVAPRNLLGLMIMSTRVSVVQKKEGTTNVDAFLFETMMDMDSLGIKVVDLDIEEDMKMEMEEERPRRRVWRRLVRVVEWVADDGRVMVRSKSAMVWSVAVLLEGVLEGMLSRRAEGVSVAAESAAQNNSAARLLSYGRRRDYFSTGGEESFFVRQRRYLWRSLGSRRRRRYHRNHREISTDLFYAAIRVPSSQTFHDDGESSVDASELPRSFPPSPRSRTAALRAEGNRRQHDLVVSRELLKAEVRLVYAEEDEFGLGVARTIRRRRVAPVFLPSAAARGVLVSGLHAARIAGGTRFASTRCAAPLPRRAWIYFQIRVDDQDDDLGLPSNLDENSTTKGYMLLDDDDRRKRSPRGNPFRRTPIVEVAIGVATTELPRTGLCGLGDSASLVSIGGLLAGSKWRSRPTHALAAFRSGDTVGVLAFHDDSWCRLRFDVNGVATDSITLNFRRMPFLFRRGPGSSSPGGHRLYPTVTFRTPGVGVHGRFSADDIDIGDPADLGLPSGEPVYALDGTRLV